MMAKEMRLYGPPGTGKTTWIAKNASECAAKFGSDQVSLCSLTNTAVKEVASREIPGTVSTLHSRCKRALFAGDPAESDIDVFMEENKAWASTTGSMPCLPAQYKKKKSNEDMLAGSQMSLFEYAQILRQQMMPRDRWPGPVRRFSEVWEDWCKQTGRMDFTGWLEASLKSNVLPPQHVVFIDEAQDHTPLQLAVIRAWKANTLILVGDDDQCCYEWSGSVPDAFFKENANLEKEKVLSQSHRVPKAVFKVADRLVRRIRSRKEKAYSPRDYEGSVNYLDYTLDAATYSGKLPDGFLENPDETYMVIASCAYMVNPIIDCLKERRIAFHNPFRPSMARWNPLKSFTRCVEAFQVKDRMWMGKEAAHWASVLRAKGVFKPRMKQRFINLCKSLDTLELKPKDIDKYFEPMFRDLAMRRDMEFIRRGQSNNKELDWDYAWDVYNSGDIKPRVIVGTIHSVKGGEADNVYVFPDLSTAGLNDFLGAGPDRIYRLFYVGVTRARKNLFLCAQNNPYRAIRWE